MNSLACSRRHLLELTAGSVLAGPVARLGAAAPDDLAPPIDERIRTLAENAPLAMRFEGDSAEAAREWQQRFAVKLRELLGSVAPPTHWRTVRERSVDLPDHRRDELVLTATGVPPLPVYVLRPKGPSVGPRPGVVAVHGHGAYGYDPIVGRDDVPGVADAIQRANYDYGRQLVRRGYVVVAPCLTPFGRRLGDRSAYGSQDPCAVTFVRLQLLGRVLMAENVRDVRWALALLARQESVDPRRLGCVGLSYGGRMTMLAAALEPRIRAAVVSGALNVMQERITKPYSCGAQVIPGLLQYGDVPEISSLIAPRPCLWEVGTRDGLISPEWAENALGRIRRAYRALGAEANLRIDRFDAGHRWHGTVAYPFLDTALRGA